MHVLLFWVQISAHTHTTHTHLGRQVVECAAEGVTLGWRRVHRPPEIRNLDFPSRIHQQICTWHPSKINQKTKKRVVWKEGSCAKGFDTKQGSSKEPYQDKALLEKNPPQKPRSRAWCNVGGLFIRCDAMQHTAQKKEIPPPSLGVGSVRGVFKGRRRNAMQHKGRRRNAMQHNT